MAKLVKRKISSPTFLLNRESMSQFLSEINVKNR